MIKKLKSGKFRLYSRKRDPQTGKARHLGTFDTREQAEKHERAVQFFKRGGNPNVQLGVCLRRGLGSRNRSAQAQ
jgi:hypothetical protein